jgi:hypothetical protein
MKRMLASALLATSLVGAPAQSVWPEALGGAALGAGLGAMIGASSGSSCGGPCGGCNNGNAGQGAAIGAGIGLIAGALAGLAQPQQQQQYEPPPPAYFSTPEPVLGYGYTPAYTAVPGPLPVSSPTAAPPRPNYVVGGTLLGAASGALIGQGTSQKPGVGAAIGAASGLVVGSVAEAARSQPPPPQAVVYTAPAPAPTLAAASPRPRHQIPDAPRVPDAPAF